jgi:hypothetical protein
MSQQPPRRSASEQLLRSARGDHAPSSVDRERVRRALSRRLSAEADASVSTTTTPAPTGLLHPLAKTGIGLVAIAAGVATLMRLNDHAPKSVVIVPPQVTLPVVQPVSEPPAVTTTPLPPPPPKAAVGTKRAAARTKAVVADSAAALVQEAHAGARPVESQPARTMQTISRAAAESQMHERRSAAQAAVSVAADAPKAERAQRSEALAARAHDSSSDRREELAFVARIRTASLDADDAQVLQLCGEHKRRWPNGMFAQEREALRAIASCQTQSVNAADIARTFSASYPESPMLPRLRAACALQLKAASPR